MSALGRWQWSTAVVAIVKGDHLRAGLGGKICYRKGELVTNEQPGARVARIAVE